MALPKINPLLKKEIDSQSRRGVLVVISGPSGAGKDTIMNAVIDSDPNVIHLVTTTSRSKRPGEKDGKDYYFISRQEFEKLIAEDAFIEWVEYRGNLYGGQIKHLRQALNSGKDVIWRIDVRGVKNIKYKLKKIFPRSALVLIIAPTFETLLNRLKKRGSETNWQNWNINMAVWEMKQFKAFNYLIVNEDGKLDKAVSELKSIITSLRLKILSQRQKQKS